MNITAEGINNKKDIEIIARDILKKLNITKSYDEYLSVAKMGIAKAIDSFDITKNTKLSTHIYNIARYTVLDYHKKIIKNNYRFKNIEDSNEISSNLEFELGIMNRIDKNFNTRVMNKALSLLNDNEVDILKKRFWKNQSFSEIARSHKKSKQAISQSVNKILKRMNNFLLKENFTDFNAIFSLEDKMSKLTKQEREERVIELKMNISKDIQSYKAYEELSTLYLQGANNNEYLSLQKDIISVFDNISEALNNAKVFSLLADAFSTIQEYEKSFMYDKKALKLEPENVQYLKNLGLSEFLLGNFYNASKYLKKVIERNNKDIESYDFLIKSLINLNKDKEVSSYYHDVISIFKDISEEINTVELFTLLADAYSVTKSYKESLKFDKKALELEPHNVQLLKNVGLSYYFLEDFDNASKYLKEVIEIDSKDEESLEFLRIISQQ